MDRSGNPLDATRTISVKSDANVKIGKIVERGEPVEHVSTQNAVHASKHEITFRNSL